MTLLVLCGKTFQRVVANGPRRHWILPAICALPEGHPPPCCPRHAPEYPDRFRDFGETPGPSALTAVR